MISNGGQLDGEEWQELVIKLLYLHYGTDLIEVPDEHGGDGGIEAFSLDGCVFQCYSPEDPATTAELAQRHKNKISKDLKKFCTNQKKLTKIFGATKIKRWLLLVPEHCSSEVVEFCSSKTEEVKKFVPAIPYVAEDFVAMTVNGNVFLAAELAKLAEVGAFLLDAKIDPVAKQEIDLFSSQHNELVLTLDDKLKKLPELAKEEDRLIVRNDMLRFHLEGGNALAYFDGRFPVIADKIRSLKEMRAKILAVESKLQKLTISGTRGSFEAELVSSVPALGRQSAITISWASVSEWLMLCPLNPKG